MIDYTIFYREILKESDDWSSGSPWDLFISAYNESERVQYVYEKVTADRKIWLAHAEYNYSEDECPECDHRRKSEPKAPIKNTPQLNESAEVHWDHGAVA